MAGIPPHLEYSKVVFFFLHKNQSSVFMLTTELLLATLRPYQTHFSVVCIAVSALISRPSCKRNEKDWGGEIV